MKKFAIGIFIYFIFLYVGAGSFAGINDNINLIVYNGNDRYIDGSSVVKHEKYAIVYQKDGTAFSGFYSDGSLVNTNDSLFVAFVESRKRKNGNVGVYVMIQSPAGFYNSFGTGHFDLYMLDTRKSRNGNEFTLADSDDNCTPEFVRSYACVQTYDTKVGNSNMLGNSNKDSNTIKNIGYYMAQSASGMVEVPVIMNEIDVFQTNVIVQVDHQTVTDTVINNVYVTNEVVEVVHKTVTDTHVNEVFVTNIVDEIAYQFMTNEVYVTNAIVQVDHQTVIDTIVNNVYLTNYVDKVMFMTNIVYLTNDVIVTKELENVITNVVQHDVYVTNTIYKTLTDTVVNNVYVTNYVDVVEEVDELAFADAKKTSYYDGSLYDVNGNLVGTSEVRVSKPDNYNRVTVRAKFKVGKKIYSKAMYGMILHDGIGEVNALKDKKTGMFNGTAMFKGNVFAGYIILANQTYEFECLFMK